MILDLTLDLFPVMVKILESTRSSGTPSVTLSNEEIAMLSRNILSKSKKYKNTELEKDDDEESDRMIEYFANFGKKKMSITYNGVKVSWVIFYNTNRRGSDLRRKCRRRHNRSLLQPYSDVQVRRRSGEQMYLMFQYIWSIYAASHKWSYTVRVWRYNVFELRSLSARHFCLDVRISAYSVQFNRVSKICAVNTLKYGCVVHFALKLYRISQINVIHYSLHCFPLFILSNVLLIRFIIKSNTSLWWPLVWSLANKIPVSSK